MYTEDLSWYKLFDTIGKKITGYAKAGDVFNDYGGGSPLFGHGPDFGYWYFGAIWYGDEIWNGARFKDYDGDGNIDQYDMLKWDDEENDGMGFFEWKPAKHPVYGDIETGGFDPKFFLQNPPSKHLETWARKEALFNLEMAKYLPELAWDNIEVKRTKSYKTDSADYQLKVSFKNTGKLPTALKQAHLVKIVSDDKVVLEFNQINEVEGKPAYKVLQEKQPSREREGRGDFFDNEKPVRRNIVTKNVPDTQGGSITSAIFNIRLYKEAKLTGKASVLSTRGGVLKDKEFSIR
jgi:hypothetical protein